MGYKTRRSIIQGSKYHKDLELAYGLDGSAMPDGRPKHSAFQKPVPEGLEKAMDSGMPKEVVEKMGFDVDTPMDKYGPYKSEHVKMDTPMDKVLDEVKVVGEKKDNLVDVTEEYKTKGNKNTRDHIAKGGKVFRAADGSLTLRSNA